MTEFAPERETTNRPAAREMRATGRLYSNRK